MPTLTPEAVRLEMVRRELARRSYRHFVPYLNPKYQPQPFNEVIRDHLNEFAWGRLKKLMITVPPQHGKSEVSTRLFPPFLFGLKPGLKIAVLSYSATKAKKFNREIQQRIDSPEYTQLFPQVRLASRKDVAATRTTEEFDIIGAGGVLKSVGRKGPLTGDPVDIAILDDLLKDGMEAQSPQIRETTWSDWLIPVVESRLHNDSQLLYVTTRWHEDDPSGRFLLRDGFHSAANPEGWVLLNFPALKTADKVPYDTRLAGEALWPEKHSRQRMEKIRQDSPLTFNALYQGDPKPSEEALIFGDWIEVDEFPPCDTVFHVIDFGFSNDPTACVKVGRTGQNLYLDEQFYLTGLTNPDILDHFHAAGLSTTLETYCDKAEPKSIEELKRGNYKAGDVRVAGINAIGVTKGPGSVNAGISKLKEFTVHYTKSSRNIKREKNNYQWIMASGKATNDPIDAYNHAIDAVRSGVYTKYSKPAGGPARVSRPGGRPSYF